MAAAGAKRKRRKPAPKRKPKSSTAQPTTLRPLPRRARLPRTRTPIKEHGLIGEVLVAKRKSDEHSMQRLLRLPPETPDQPYGSIKPMNNIMVLLSRLRKCFRASKIGTTRGATSK